MAVAAASELERVDDHLGLNNLDYGAWEGLTKEECAAHDPEAFRLYAEAPEDAACPDGEALARAADRMVEALYDICRRHPKQSVAAVSHGAMVRLAVLRIAGPTIGDWQFKLSTGSATVIDYADGELRIASALNRHLPDPHKAAAGTVDSGEAVAS
jgi:broad specificity phosphatase PhoE